MTDPICQRCGEPRSKHLWMGRGDIMADMLSAPALVCPTALFLEHVEHNHNAVGYRDGDSVPPPLPAVNPKKPR